MKSLSFVFLLLFIASCGKAFKTTVKGKVLNPVTGLGIENARVILQKAGGGLPAGLETVEFVYTDASGNFEISAKKLKSLTASVILDGNDYYSIGWKESGNDFSVLSPKKGEVTEADFWAVPFGELKISLHNVNCQGSTDSLYFERIYLTSANVVVFQPFTLTGCYNNDGSFAKVQSGQYLIKWKVTRAGITNNYSQELTVNENQQTYYNIDY
jgi:hypothetical protein